MLSYGLIYDQNKTYSNIYIRETETERERTTKPSTKTFLLEFQLASYFVYCSIYLPKGMPHIHTPIYLFSVT